MSCGGRQGAPTIATALLPILGGQGCSSPLFHGLIAARGGLRIHTPPNIKMVLLAMLANATFGTLRVVSIEIGRANSTEKVSGLAAELVDRVSRAAA